MLQHTHTLKGPLNVFHPPSSHTLDKGLFGYPKIFGEGLEIESSSLLSNAIGPSGMGDDGQDQNWAEWRACGGRLGEKEKAMRIPNLWALSTYLPDLHILTGKRGVTGLSWGASHPPGTSSTHTCLLCLMSRGDPADPRDTIYEPI